MTIQQQLVELARRIGMPATVLGTALLVGELVAAQASKNIDQDGSRVLSAAAIAEHLAGFREQIGRRMVADRLSRKGKRAVDRWLGGFKAVQTEHYLIFTNASRKTAQGFGGSLERLYGWMKKRFPIEDVDHLHKCYIFKKHSEYVDYCVKVVGLSEHLAVNSGGHGIGAYFACYAQSPDSALVIHEAAHQLVQAGMRIPCVGSWFQEGMAVYVQRRMERRKVASGMKHYLRRGDFRRLHDFVQMTNVGADRKRQLQDYEQAAALIKFLIESRHPRIKGRFVEFLEACRRKPTTGLRLAEHLVEKVYGMSLAELEVAFKAHYRVPGARTRTEKRAFRGRGRSNKR